jgi:tetratricopeptide (TPR) repeat protein
MMFRKNPVEKILGITEKLVEGEILLREGQAEPGLTALRDAVQREDDLRYAEPPAWIQPVRHALGASLMARGRFAEAEQVYRDDLAKLPDNGWSLFGLARSLRLQKKNSAEAAALEARYKIIWAKGDFELNTSCLCQPGV